MLLLLPMGCISFWTFVYLYCCLQVIWFFLSSFIRRSTSLFLFFPALTCCGDPPLFGFTISLDLPGRSDQPWLSVHFRAHAALFPYPNPRVPHCLVPLPLPLHPSLLTLQFSSISPSYAFPDAVSSLRFQTAMFPWWSPAHKHSIVSRGLPRESFTFHSG